MKKYAVLIALIALAALFFAVSAEGTQELQPTYRLMNGDEELGVVYALDYGWLILTGEDTLYVCGCDGCYATQEPTAAPTDEPTQEPTVVPTDEPTKTPKPTQEPTDKPKCNSGRGNGSEGDPDCDPGNSGGHNHGGD